MLFYILAVVYGLGTVATWALGAFHIGITRDEWKQNALKESWKRYPDRGIVNDWSRERDRVYDSYMSNVYFGVSLMWLFAGFTWPLATPLYLAWKKGDLYSKALEARDERTRQLQEGAN